MCPRPPQLWHIIIAPTPSLPILLKLSLCTPPPPRALLPLSLSEWLLSPFGHSLATWPEMLQMLQTGSLGQSRAMWPEVLQFLHALSFVQSAARWPGLKQLLQSRESPGREFGLGQSLTRCPDLPHEWQIPSFVQFVATWPGSLQFQHLVSAVHSAAMCLQRERERVWETCN